MRWPARTRRLNLALQGGGAHGAFTWGVLQRLLEVDRLRFEGISGTSAGAVNGVVLASGLLAGGAAGALENLDTLWQEVIRIGRPWHRNPAACRVLDATTQLLSPYQLNPFDINPLRDLLERLVDFERLRQDRSLRLFVAATTLRAGALRIFENHELTVETVLASACLPSLHQAIEIDDEAYWDGGYVSNPPILPVVERCPARDLLLVRINPRERGTLPRNAGEIRSRVGEIVFAQPLERELALIAARRGSPFALNVAERRLARHRLHVIDGGAMLAGLDPRTRMIPAGTTLTHLRKLGAAAASAWLASAAPW